MAVLRTGAANASGTYLAPLPPVPQYLRDGAIQSALNRLKDGDFNAAQVVAERSQVARMTRDNLDTMRKEVDNIRKGPEKPRPPRRGEKPRKPGFKDSLDRLNARHISGKYLELVYGWRPLLSDVRGAVEALCFHEAKDNEYFVTVKGSRREGFYQPREVVHQVAGVNFVVKSSLRGNHSVKVRLDYVKNNAPLVAFSQLGLTNPLLLAWELLPYSFVADWFFPVGNYLNILDADYGWSFKGGSMSRITRGSQRAQSAHVHPMHAGAGITGGLSARGRSYQMFFRRDVYSESPLPALPRFKPAANAEHVFNGIALLRLALDKAFK
jgi:hypothetical protein